jgi:hypothetical protein
LRGPPPLSLSGCQVGGGAGWWVGVGACRCGVLGAPCFVARPGPSPAPSCPSASRRALPLSLSRRLLPVALAAWSFHPNGLASVPLPAQRAPGVVVPQVPWALRSGLGLLPPGVQGFLELPQGSLQPLESLAEALHARVPRLVPPAILRSGVVLVLPALALSSVLAALRRPAPWWPVRAVAWWRRGARSSVLAVARWRRAAGLPSTSSVVPPSLVRLVRLVRAFRTSRSVVCDVAGWAPAASPPAALAAPSPPPWTGVLRLPNPRAPHPVVVAGLCSGGVLGPLPRRCVRCVPAHACLPTEVDRLRRVSRVDSVPEHALPWVGRHP